MYIVLRITIKLRDQKNYIRDKDDSIVLIKNAILSDT